MNNNNNVIILWVWLNHKTSATPFLFMSTMLYKTEVTLYLILVLIVGTGLGQMSLCGHEFFDIQTLLR